MASDMASISRSRSEAVAAVFGDRAFPGTVCSTVGRIFTRDVLRGQEEERPAAQQPRSHLASPGKAVNTTRFLCRLGGAGLGTNRDSKSTGAAAHFGLETAFGHGVASAEHPETALKAWSSVTLRVQNVRERSTGCPVWPPGCPHVSKPRLTPTTPICVSRSKGPGEGTVVPGKSNQHAM